MKLVAVVLAAFLAVPAVAHADAAQHAKNHELKRALMQQFDMNGDGRLGPRERIRAIRVLGRVQMKLAGGRRGQMKRLIEKYDTNGDGDVDRGEMPPAQARKLRKLDRDRDGWVEPNEVR